MEGMEFPGGKRGESGKRISKEKAKASINRADLAEPLELKLEAKAQVSKRSR